MKLKSVSARNVRVNSVVLLRHTDLSYTTAKITAVKPYGEMEVTLEYEICVYKKTYGNKRLIIPSTDILLVVVR